MIIVIVLAIILIALSFIKGIKIINNIKASNVLALECHLEMNIRGLASND